MNRPVDQPSRERFVSELDRNFSVVASAGSGKTRAITDRIVQIAKSPQAREWLPQLVVVAFTNRTADEMQQRARAEVLQANLPTEVLAAFNRAFFGTIHSFCVRLLETYGHYLGLPPNFEVITDDDEIWSQFVQRQTIIGRCLSEENRCTLLRHVQARSLMELGRRADLSDVAPPGERCPDADFSAIYRFVAKGPTVQTVPPFQKELKRAEEIWRNTANFVRWPVCLSQAKDFVRIKREAFAPLRKWIDQAALCVATEVQRDYRAFRLERGLLTYDDQIALALELMRHPQVGRQIREKSFRVILDEAQDTDSRQFSLLLELARPAPATGEWLETQADHPQPGHFCMVGDFQQSIYRDRADLGRYRLIHNRLVESGAAEALTFSVTFRLDERQVGFVNEIFREILNDRDRQVAFVELNPRPDVLPGQVVRLNLQPAKLKLDPRGKVSDARKAAEEARQLGQWIRDTGPQKLRAQTWRDVAILCPRKEWLQTLRRGLRSAGLNVQIQSEKELKGDSPAYAWLTTLLIMMAQPRCGYEIAGLLRELFGISDHDLAVFAEGYGDRFQIEIPTSGSDVVSKKLNQLTEIRLSIASLPLFDAVSKIVHQTELRERLLSLPAEDFEDLAGELDALLALAGSSEADGIGLVEFAELLRNHFADPREIRPSRADAIQLITSQKAKGSEWQAVIVPFLTRDIRSAPARYPSLPKKRDTGETIVLLDPSDATGEIKEEMERDARQEMERLLYVALTRAKHTLVLAFDNELFAKTGGEIHSHSQSKWLKAGKSEENEAAFVAIETEPASCAVTTGRHESTSPAKSEVDIPLPAKVDRAKAIKNASIFVRKLNPSGLLPEESPEIEREWSATEPSRPLASGSPALQYGLWWHDFVERLAWTGSSKSWSDVFEDCEKVSPDRARSLREWKLLLKHLAGGDDFRKPFHSKALSEMPFFWQVDDARVLEGIIDLAILSPSSGRALILDWKTDRVPLDNTETLQARYRPQLAAYWKAFRELTGMEADAAIYSTAAGVLVRYQADELEKEWRSLQKKQPDQFEKTIADERIPKSTERATQLELLKLE